MPLPVNVSSNVHVPPLARYSSVKFSLFSGRLLNALSPRRTHTSSDTSTAPARFAGLLVTVTTPQRVYIERVGELAVAALVPAVPPELAMVQLPRPLSKVSQAPTPRSVGPTSSVTTTSSTCQYVVSEPLPSSSVRRSRKPACRASVGTS